MPSLPFVLPGLDIVVEVRRAPTARRLTLRVRSAHRDAVLTVPARTSLGAARAFAERHVDWLRERLARLPEPVPFVDGALVPLRGTPHRVVAKPAGRGLARAVADPDGEPTIIVAGPPEHLSRRLTDFLKREARRDLEAAVVMHAATLDVSPGRIRLGDATSRWGSCSPRGGLAFSWRLILAPPHVLDYLAAHEVAHRREMNHGPRFWATVARLRPDYELSEAWLRAHGAGLHRYGAEA
jgi:predicted metal-dependent hydrolase